MTDTNSMSDLSSMLPFLVQGKQGKSNLSALMAMLGALDNPFLGVMSGAYDPLSQQSQGQDVPESPIYDDINMTPESPATLKRVAQAVVDENLPLHRVNKIIEDMQVDSSYSTEDLKSVASQLYAEKNARDAAMNKSRSDNLFTKAGLPNITEQYSDNPALAPFNAEALNYMNELGGTASSLRGQADYATRNIAGANKKAAAQNLNAEQIQKLLKQNAKDMMKGAGQTSRLKQDWSSILPFQTIKRVFDNPFNNEEPFLSTEGTIIDKTGRGKNEQVFKDYQKKEKELKSALAKAKQYETKYGKGSKAPINEVYGDLSDPKNLAKYFEIQSKIQNAAALDKQAKDYASGIIGKAEAEGRTPTTDAVTKRIMGLLAATSPKATAKPKVVKPKPKP